MITELTIRNFKGISDQTYTFTKFDLLVGRNNSGKSTILQAMAIWQYCVDAFRRSKQKKSGSIQIVLPNFTALPLPEFNLLWKGRYIARQQKFILIEIILKFKKKDDTIEEFGVSVRYQSPQAIYAFPQKGWSDFYKLYDDNVLPRLVYVPPFSGLDPFEILVDDAVVRRNVGKGQPGSVLRNILYRVSNDDENWEIIEEKVKEWFDVDILPPDYEGGESINIEIEYQDKDGRKFDIISGGSGFHQALTLLAFYYGYEGLTTILFDEPDAHMHVNLQREILNYFQRLNTTQFIIATHAEEFIKRVYHGNIISLLNQKPERIESTQEIITALSDVNNMEIVNTEQDPFILYVEGEDDERILNAWASVLDKQYLLKRFYVKIMGGTSKVAMREFADEHIRGLRKIVPTVNRVMLFDYDSDETHLPNNEVIFEWKRKNIENYLLVSETWKRAADNIRNETDNTPIIEAIETFFNEQNLTLPKTKTWRDVAANIFSEVNGKKILFENKDSLFQILRERFGLIINRVDLCNSFLPEELHQDVIDFFDKLEAVIESALESG
ncbi:MAG: AAA family ATPase [Nitrospirae bacterium]|nr:AAA family ATPase [Nitrospirota bacterium]